MVRWLRSIPAPALVLVSMAVRGQESDIRNEIAQLKRERSRVYAEIAEVRRDSAADAEEFREYTARTAVRLRRIGAETDSLRGEIGRFRQQSDSLGALISAQEAVKRRGELAGEAFRSELIEVCEGLAALCRRLPPSGRDRLLSAVRFLAGELESRAVDNTEGLHRFARLARDVEQSLADIQLEQGASPLEHIGGTVYRIRIGGVYEALVDSEARRCAVWTGAGGASDTTWKVIGDEAVARRVLKAVRVREGKALPEVVRMPFPARGKGGGDDDE